MPLQDIAAYALQAVNATPAHVSPASAELAPVPVPAAAAATHQEPKPFVRTAAAEATARAPPAITASPSQGDTQVSPSQGDTKPQVRKRARTLSSGPIFVDLTLLDC